MSRSIGDICQRLAELGVFPDNPTSGVQKITVKPVAFSEDAKAEREFNLTSWIAGHNGSSP